MDRLDLLPRLAPPAGLVGRVGRLDHHPLVAGGQGFGCTAVGLGGSAVTTPGMRNCGGDRARARPSRSPQRPVEQVDRRRRGGSRRTTGAAASGRASSAPKRAIESWNERGRSSSSIISVSPSSTTELDRERPDRRDHLGQAGGDVVEVAGEHRHLVAEAVDLDAGAVELPLHRRRRRARPARPRRRWRWRRASAAPAAAPRGPPPPSEPPPLEQRQPRRSAPAGRRACGPGGPPSPAPRPPWPRRRPSRPRARPGAARRPAAAGGTSPRRRWPDRAGRRGASLRAADRARAGRGHDLVEGAVEVGDGERSARSPAGTSSSATVAQPTPIRPWRASPVSHPTAASTSSGPSRPSSAASASTLAVRAGWRSTVSDVATTSASAVVAGRRRCRSVSRRERSTRRGAGPRRRCVVSSPWPVCTTVSAGSGSSRVRMLSTIVAKSENDRPVAPGPAVEQRVAREEHAARGVVQAAAAGGVARACAAPRGCDRPPRSRWPSASAASGRRSG